MPNIRLNYPHIAHTLHIPDLEDRLKAPCRAPKIVDIRRALAAILFEQGYSKREIAHEFCRHRTTILHFLRSHENLLATDAAYHLLFQQIYANVAAPSTAILRSRTCPARP